jgi:predicted signal transduction protein with EAL and GGDEF domain
MRAGDTASRFGGDEFAVVVEGVLDVTDVMPVAERILAALRAPVSVGGRELSLGASIGIAVASGNDSAEELLRYATVAMHESKAAGRGRLQVFEPGMHERLVSRVQLQSDLGRALANDELTLYFQPVVSLADGVVTGFEALLRWLHPERGLLLPDTFIPLAEDHGSIVAIDRWVLSRACSELMSWAPDVPLRLNVNINRHHRCSRCPARRGSFPSAGRSRRDSTQERRAMSCRRRSPR